MSPARLSTAQWRAEVAPAWGASLLSLDHLTPQGWAPVLRPYRGHTPPASPNELACYPLLPWSNRVAEGRFAFEGHTRTVPRNVPSEPCPIHGHGWLAEWAVREQGAQSVLLACTHQGLGPFAYEATLRYALQGDGLHCRLWLRNLGERLPFGLGLHPFFVRTPDVTLQAPTQGLWASGEDHLPTQHHQPVPPDWAFHAPRPLPDTLIDHAYSGWSGEAVLAWPASGLRVCMQADVDHLVIYTPPGERFFCVEPVDHPINALNLPDAVRGGLTVLATGATLQRDFRFTAC